MAAISAALARSCVRRVRELAGGTFPVDVREIAYEMGVDILEPADIVVDGYVGTTSDGKRVIRYRRNSSHLRNRFTIAHEIGHLVISEVSGVQLTELKSRKGFDCEELLANRLAAELLMPEQVLREQLQVSDPCWGAVQKIRKSFDVSAHALLRRTTELNGVIAVFARRRSTFTCDATSVPPVYFSEPFQDSMTRVADGGKGIRFSVCATAVGCDFEIPCELRVADSAPESEEWAFGWTMF